MSEPLSELNILYVEDDLMTQEEILFTLEPLVAKIWAARNGEEGLGMFHDHYPDVILTDIQMPAMDGLSMIERIKETHPKIPVVVMTAFNDTHYLFKAIELGISHYVTKPVNLKSLISKLEEIAEQIALKKKTQRQEKLLQQYKNAIDRTMSVTKSDFNGMITYANDAFCAQSGYASDELVGGSYTKIRFDNEPDETFHEMWETVTCGKTWHGTIRNRTKKGTHFILDTTVFPLFDDDDHVIEYVSIGHDVTELFGYRDFLEVELKRNRKNLAETINYLEQYQNALQAGTAVCHMSLEGKILRANETFCDLLGYTPSSILDVRECAICRSDGFNVHEMLNILLKENIYKQDIRYLARNGSKKTFNSIFVPIRDVGGNVIEILTMHHDISELLELNREITNTQHEILMVLGEVAENKSEETGSHVRRVAAYSRFLAEKYGLSGETARMIEMIAPMHDIGKIAIPDAILHKPGKLDAQEWETMKQHAQKGHDMLSHSDRPLMKNAAIAALHHHEKYDGSGYPSGLRGEEIHIIGRILAVADVFDSLGTKRAYKEPWTLDAILAYFREQRGRHFDPKLVDILLNHIDEILELKETASG